MPRCCPLRGVLLFSPEEEKIYPAGLTPWDTPAGGFFSPGKTFFCLQRLRCVSRDTTCPMCEDGFGTRKNDPITERVPERCADRKFYGHGVAEVL